MLSAVPQPGEVYRFRSVDALIGPHKELYRQTIYLARPEQLSDPAEDTVNVIWRGDEILWPNLITYYWRSFVASAITRGIFLPGHHVLLPDYRPLERSELSTVVENEVVRLRERYSTQTSEVLAELSQRNSPISYFELQQILPKLTPPEHYRFFQPAGLPPLDDFPSTFVQAMGKILLSEWRVACFTNDFTNPFLWSVYGDDHAGVCLVFDRKSLQNLGPLQDRYDAVGLEEVSYQLKKPEIEFFTSLPLLTRSEYERLFTDENGVPSPNCPFLPEDKGKIGEAREKQRRSSRSNLLTKQKYYKAEKEVRMFCQTHWRDDDLDPAKYTVQYPIEALKGITFGRRTTQEHRQAILDVILAKHYVNPIREDFWFMEAAPQPDGSVWKRPYSPYVGWQHNFVYPKKR